MSELEDVLQSIARVSTTMARLKPVYPLFVMTCVKQGITLDNGKRPITLQHGEIQSLGNSAYALRVTDDQGNAYRVTVECTGSPSIEARDKIEI